MLISTQLPTSQCGYRITDASQGDVRSSKIYNGGLELKKTDPPGFRR